MMKTNDYMNYDSLTIYVKHQKKDEIIEYYKILGYTLCEVQENKRYEDIVDLTFTRPHKIENKDELQLLQVYMEEKLNEMAKLEKHKNSKTTIFGLCFGSFAILFLILGILGVFNIINFLNLPWCIAFICLGCLCLILELFMLPKIHKKEKIDFIKNHRQNEELLNDIIQKVKKLGDTNGK